MEQCVVDTNKFGRMLALSMCCFIDVLLCH